MDLPFYDDHYGISPVLKSRGIIGTSLVNINALIQKVNWQAIFDIGYKLDITSSSTADAAAGTGMRTVIVYGLDDVYNPLTEVVTMNGQTIVTTANKFRRVFAAYALTFGSGLLNAGDIYFMRTGTGGTYTTGVPGTLTSGAMKMLIGDNLAYSGVWTAPRGTVYHLDTFIPAGNKASSVQIVLGFPADTQGRGPFAIYKVDVGVGIGAPYINPNITIFEKQDIYTQGFALAATTTVTNLMNFRKV